MYYSYIADTKTFDVVYFGRKVIMPDMNVKFAFLGAGNIAKAIIGGLLENGLVDALDVFVYDTDNEKYKSDIMRRVNCCSSAEEAVSAADLVVFALKPSVISSAAKAIADNVKNYRNKTYLSVAAAVSTDFICRCLGADVAVIRTMPNTPLLLGKGAVAVSRNMFVSDKLFSYVCRLLSGISVISVIEEALMDRIVSVNGSSPAYVYLFYKSMLDAAVSQGVPDDKASALIIQSIKGALAMIEHSGKDVSTLIKDVSSPGGTTLAALSVFEEKKFASTVCEAMLACTKRAEEMAQEIEKGE